MNILSTGTLSEQEITEITLLFLKRYYRNRLRQGEMDISSNVRGAGGIIADGFLKYDKGDGTHFVATFEATSFETREEVRFTHRRNLLFWDGVVFALWGTAVGGGVNISQQLIPIKTHGPILPLVMLLCTFTALFFSFLIIAGYWRRYREIYAIEQFKQYHMNEQWVAVGKDVFRQDYDPHLEELRRQCIKHGFGLLLIDLVKRVHTHITPSREDTFDGRRRVVQMLSGKQFLNRMQNTADKEWIRRFQGRLARAMPPNTPEWLKRFRPRRPRHHLAAILALVFILAIWYREYDAIRLRKVAPEEYEREVVKQARQFPKDPPGYRLDTPFFPPLPFQGDRISYLDEWLRDREYSVQALALRNVIGNQDGRGVTLYDCARFRNFKGVKFILIDEIYPDFESAMFRVKHLQADGHQAGSLWLGCFIENSDEFAVFFGSLFNTAREAQRLAEKLEPLRSERRSKDFLTVKAIKN